MDKISRLHDDLLVKVLSFLPTKVAVSTSILSKRWEFLWMWLPKLEYDCTNYSNSERERLRKFINLNLPLHKAPVIESLRLNFIEGSIEVIEAQDIRFWVVIAVSRCVRELSVRLSSCGDGPTKLPSSLYSCKSLVILELIDEILVDVPRIVCLPSLKTLLLRRVSYADEKSLHQLLSNSPVLEDLVLERDEFDHSETLSVIVPSLQGLTLKIYRGNFFDSLTINTPSLKYLKFVNRRGERDSDSDSDSDDNYSFDFKDMPKLEEANIDSTYPSMDKYVRSIKFVKRLSLCIRVDVKEALYRDGNVFNQLEHLKLCPCEVNWSKGLVRLLKDSPNLRELEIGRINYHQDDCEDPWVSWQNHDLDCVPQCLLESLETFKWDGIKGSQKEIDLVKYILGNACCLKTATILFWPSRCQEEEINFEMIKQELSLSFRGSTTSQLVFN